MATTLSYEWDNGEVLSVRGDENNCTVRERQPHTLLRPVFINAVEVGYAYAQCEKDRRLNVRGVTIALWHFISRGHQALALLPYCFKSYADKSSSWSELMALFKMNLVEFTPGFGSDKYTEVNRIMATRADEVGGCLVARSQMHNIVEERPHLHRTIERRLLMPSFSGEDIIFPVDGPLGRSGPTLQATLECPLTEEEWGRCSHHQMNLKDQKIWMQKLSHNIPEHLSWGALTRLVEPYQPSVPLPVVELPPRPLHLSHAKVHPPETNPVDGKGYSYTRAALRRACNQDVCAGDGRIYGVGGLGPMQTYRDVLGLSGRDMHNPNYCDDERSDPFLPEYMLTGVEVMRAEPRFEDSAPPLPSFLGNADSIYRIRTTSTPCPKLAANKKKGEKPEEKPEEAVVSEAKLETINKLAAIFGLKKATRVANKNPTVTNVNLLIEFALNDSEGNTSCRESTEPSNSSEDQTELSLSPPDLLYSLLMDVSLGGLKTAASPRPLV